MTIRHIVVIAVIVTVAVLGGRAAWNKRAHLMANKAVYLSNQGEWEAAHQQLDAARRAGVDDDATREAAARIALNLGRPEAALADLGEAGGGANAQFLRGAALLLMGREGEAANSFERSLANSRELGPTRSELALCALAALRAGGVFPEETPVLRYRDPLLRLLRDTLRGRQRLQEERFAEAATLLVAAMDAGDRTSRTASLAAAAAAMSLQPGLADYAVAKNGTPRATTSDTAAVIDELVDAAPHVLGVTGLTAADQRQFESVMARAWALQRAAILGESEEAVRGCVEQLGRLIEREPESRLLRVFRAEAWEGLGEYRRAFEEYGAIAEETSCMACLVRMRDLAGWETETREAVEAFASAVEPVFVARGSELETSGAVETARGVSLRENGAFSLMVPVARAGRHLLAVVAESAPAFGLGPVVNVEVDGAPAGRITMARDGWDCYELPLMLQSGDRRVVLKYENDEDNLLSGETERFLTLEMVLLIPLETVTLER